jgi:hypothetical protein
VIRTVLRTGLATAAATVLMAGCGAVPEAGAAATVGDRRISVQEVQTATADIQKMYGPDQPVPQRSVLYLLAAAPYIQEIATRDRAGTSLDDARKAFGDKVRNPAEASLVVVQANLALGRLDELGSGKTEQALMEVTKDLARDDFTVSPRYGTFDAQRGSLLPDQPNWLPTPSASPAQP